MAKSTTQAEGSTGRIIQTSLYILKQLFLPAVKLSKTDN